MKKYFLIVAVMIFSIYMFGCGKKQAEEQLEPMSMEALSTLNTSTQAPATPESVKISVPKPQTMQTQPPVAQKLEPLPPAGPYKPTNIEIQTALKNANLYTGAIDGKIGSMTRKAVEAFQKANNLNADGKVGTKTWGLLSKYLNPPAPETPVKKRRR
jgi:peptidoglycan hydrolase-like protein with peptidoglycan-binding domain